MTSPRNKMACTAVPRETHAASAENGSVSELLAEPDLQERYGITTQPIDETAVQSLVVDLLQALGEQPSREGLLDTPRRVAKAYRELVSGYTTDPVKLMNNAVFTVEYTDMVVVSDIEYYSLCEHHLLPFIGRAHVAYIPGDKVIGLSKIPRIVDMFANRLQVQERLTQQVAEFLNELLSPRGVAVAMTAQHMCSMIRGVKKFHPKMTTRAMLGEFACSPDLRSEFFSQIMAQSPL
ncbi:MAG: GTP cyclohydrolase I FolE [Chloroflexi bacterium]|nr:GTP cyclohydrolase I FolE [Chloroflexota bacterium]MCY4248154.1 GTP cyclohydrolase I FolE [Chloroflexota bacterium]